MKDKIDVILPVYNGEKYLGKCLDSLKKQTYTNFKVIIINDGSIDRTKKIAETYSESDNRFKLINRKNVGLIKSLNYGLNCCDSKYIARMDADDICHPERLDKQKKLLEQSDIDICGTNAICIDEYGKAGLLKKRYKFPKDKNRAIARTFIRTPMLHPSVMFKLTTKIESDLFYLEEDYLCEDFGLWCRLMNKGVNVSNVQDSLMQYRLHDESLSRSKATLMKENACNIIRSNFNNHGVIMDDEEFYSYKKFRNHDYKDLSKVDYFNLNAILRKSKENMDREIYKFLEREVMKLLVRSFIKRK